MLKDKNIKQLEAWTRDDKWVNNWYENRGFKLKEHYLHVYTDGDECDEVSDSKIEKLFLMNTFAHYVGENEKEIKEKFKRVHECNLYRLKL